MDTNSFREILWVFLLFGGFAFGEKSRSGIVMFSMEVNLKALSGLGCYGENGLKVVSKNPIVVT